MKEPRGKILVIRGGAIGDFILTLPVLTALRRQFPEARLEVLGYSHIAQLALAGGLADEVKSIEARALAGFFARNGRLDDGLGGYFAAFAVIISYLFDPDEIFRTNVARCSKAQFIAGPHRPDEKLSQHATEVFLKPLERLAVFDADPVPQLSVSSRPPSLNLLALHPGSGSERKNWPEENWMRLVQHVQIATRLNLLLVGGEAEGDRVRRLSAHGQAGRVQLAQNLPLTELARLLAGCVGFVGHDSGITHLAAALGLDCLVLWGDTREAIWRPRGGRVRVVRAPDGLQGLSIERVLGELDRKFIER